MKNLFTTIIAVISMQLSIAQCIDFFQDTIVTCASSSVTFDGVPTGQLVTIQELADFNSGVLPPGWSTTGGTAFSQPCGTSLDNTPYFWASTSGTTTPAITSPSYDFTAGGYFTFEFKYANQGVASPCEGPDLENEGMSVQYSIDGGLSWFEFVYFSPGGFQLPTNPGTSATAIGGPAPYNTPYTSWTEQTIPIPAAAQTANTILRWTQDYSSGACCDNWGVDNINVYGNVPGINYLWNTGATTLPLTTSSPVDSSFQLSVYDGNNLLLCQDTVRLEITNIGFDNAIYAVAEPFVQGLSSDIFFLGQNYGCPSQNGQVVVQLDTLLTFVSSTPMPTTITSDSLIYDYTNLHLNGTPFQMVMNGTVSQQAVVGDQIDIDTYITPVTGDLDPTNNERFYDFPVMASYDPNDKQVYPKGDCDVGYVENNQLMTYTVRFQNTGNSPAIDVRVNDVLDANLDPATLRVVGASHNYEIDWVSSNVIDFLFEDINLPAQSQDDVGSNGYIIFEIEQVQGLQHGESFSNFVDIYFDFNAPITTNTVLNTVTDGSHAPTDTLFAAAVSSYNWNGQTYTSSGIYTETFPLPDGCDSTEVLHLLLDIDAGLTSLHENPFVIYPNPASNYLTIKGSQEGVIRLIDNAGSIVLEENIFGDATIQWDNLSVGMYVVEIESEQKLYREKLIIRK